MPRYGTSYRFGDPGHDHVGHLDFGRRQDAPLRCRAPCLPGDNHAIGSRCYRPAVYLCDGLGGHDANGDRVDCNMPVCPAHATHVGGQDFCPRHRPGRRDR